MNIKLGNFKVAIHAGINEKTGNGIIEFRKLFKPLIDEKSNYYDVPFIIEFSSIQSVESVINALEHVKGVMYEKGHK